MEKYEFCRFKSRSGGVLVITVTNEQLILLWTAERVDEQAGKWDSSPAHRQVSRNPPVSATQRKILLSKSQRRLSHRRVRI